MVGRGSGRGEGSGAGSGSGRGLGLGLGEGGGALQVFLGRDFLLFGEVVRDAVNVHVRNIAKTTDWFPRGPFFRRLRALGLSAGRDTAPLGLEGGVCLWAFALDVTEAVALSLAFGCAALVDLRLDLVACAYVREDTALGVSTITAARAC